MAVKNSVAISLEKVSFTYPDGTQALKNIDLQIHEGERLAIIGANGSGKSTLLALLNGVLKPVAGEVRIFNRPVNRQNDRQIKQWVGLVFQNPEDQLFCPTVYQDVAFGPQNFGLDETQVRDRVLRALQEIGLEGYENRSTFNMSFGEKKLVSLATVLALSPRIVALDEPTGNLDALHRRKLMQWVQMNGRTCVITSHDLDMVYDVCERTVILNKGQIVASGNTLEILTDERLLNENSLELPLRLQHK